MSHRVKKANTRIIQCATNLAYLRRDVAEQKATINTLEQKLYVLKDNGVKNQALKDLLRRMAQRVKRARIQLAEKEQEIKELRQDAKETLFSKHSDIQSEYKTKLRDLEAKYQQQLKKADESYRLARDETIGISNRIQQLETLQKEWKQERDKIQAKYERELLTCAQGCDRKVTQTTEDFSARINELTAQLDNQKSLTVSCEKGLKECSKIIPEVAQVKPATPKVQSEVVQPLRQPQPFLADIQKRRFDDSAPAPVKIDVQPKTSEKPKAPEIPGKANLLEQIRAGKELKKVEKTPLPDTRQGRPDAPVKVDLLAQIRAGQKLKKVEKSNDVPKKEVQDDSLAGALRGALKVRRQKVGDETEDDDWD